MSVAGLDVVPQTGRRGRRPQPRDDGGVEWLTVSAAARLISVPRKTVVRWLSGRPGCAPAVPLVVGMVGEQVRIHRASVLAQVRPAAAPFSFFKPEAGQSE